MSDEDEDEERRLELELELEEAVESADADALRVAIDKARSSGLFTEDSEELASAVKALEGQTVVTCPEGSGEGDALLVTTPGGKEVEIIIPPGVKAGDDFHVSFEEEDDASGEEAPEPSVVEQSQQVVEQA